MALASTILESINLKNIERRLILYIFKHPLLSLIQNFTRPLQISSLKMFKEYL